MDFQKIISKTKKLIHTDLSDAELIDIIDEGMSVATRGLIPATIEDVYSDDMLCYYLASQIGLINGDFALYNNFIVMFNTALAEFRTIMSETSPVQGVKLRYKNIFG